MNRESESRFQYAPDADSSSRQREVHHLTPRELAWRPDTNTQSESTQRWRDDNTRSVQRPVQVNDLGMYTVINADTLSTIAERYLRSQGAAKPSGADVRSEMNRIVTLNCDAYPDLARNPDLIKSGMHLRLQPDNDSAGSQIGIPPVHPPEHHVHGKHDVEQYRHEHGYERSTGQTGQTGDQVAQTVLPMIANVIGGLIGGGGNRYGGAPFFGGGNYNGGAGYYGGDNGYYGGGYGGSGGYDVYGGYSGYSGYGGYGGDGGYSGYGSGGGYGGYHGRGGFGEVHHRNGNSAGNGVQQLLGLLGR